MQLVTFLADGQRHALPLAAVERVLQAVEITPLPGAPAAVPGVIDVAGALVPVFCLRRQGGTLQPDPGQQLLLARTPRRRLALLVDEVLDVADREPLPVAGLTRGVEALQGLARLDDGLLLIHDLERFLSPREEQALDEALRAS